MTWFDQHRSATDLALKKARDRLDLADQLRCAARNSWEHKLFGRKIFKTREWRAADRVQYDPIMKPLSSPLRSLHLRPSADLSNGLPSETAQTIVFEVIHRRSQLVGEEGISQQTSGRILLYVPEENLACGTAEVGSFGFFDVNNIPPWDTWVGFENGTLVSWIPEELVGIVNSGIDANPELCIRWAWVHYSHSPSRF